MKKEEFIKLIESKGFVDNGMQDYEFHLLRTTLVIWVLEFKWELTGNEPDTEVEYLSLKFPKTEADATEFFRILGI